MKKILLLMVLISSVGCDKPMVRCSYSGFQGGRCFFTKSGGAPASGCVKVVITKRKTKQVDFEVKQLAEKYPSWGKLAEEDQHSIGEKAESGPICSPVMWTDGTVKVDFELNR